MVNNTLAPKDKRTLFERCNKINTVNFNLKKLTYKKFDLSRV